VVLEVGVIGLGDAFGLGGVGRPRFLLVFNIGFDLSVAVAWQSCNFPSSELIKYFFLMSRNRFFFFFFGRVFSSRSFYPMVE
jgi:hypothetical protein